MLCFWQYIRMYKEGYQHPYIHRGGGGGETVIKNWRPYHCWIWITKYYQFSLFWGSAAKLYLLCRQALLVVPPYHCTVFFQWVSKYDDMNGHLLSRINHSMIHKKSDQEIPRLSQGHALPFNKIMVDLILISMSFSSTFPITLIPKCPKICFNIECT